MPGFEPRTRTHALTRLADTVLDVLVVGGGITGAGVAREAALRDLTVGLVEARDFASGTSSRSSKLIHGGIRYLAQGEVGLVREAARERTILRQIAPHLTTQVPMLLPVYGRTSAGVYKLRVGLTLFDKLAAVPPDERHRVLSRNDALAAEPLLAPERLQGAAVYPEYVTDDARLVLDTLKSAHHAGAAIVNYVRVSALGESDGLRTVDVRDETNGDTFTIRAKVVVNAGGPWVDQLGRLEATAAPLRLHLSKGIHIVLRADALPIHHCVVLPTVDGRSAFIVPRGRHLYIGTTDTSYEGTLDEPPVTAEDVEYLLAALRRTLPTPPLGEDDVVGTWAGVRPLVHEEGKSPSEISRKDEIYVSERGLVTIAGGKLTTYRRMAERVLETCAPQLGRRFLRSTSGTIPLAGGDLGGAADLTSWAAATRVRSALEGVPADTAQRLIAVHGSDALEVIACAIGPADLKPLADRVPLTRAEVRHAVRKEMAATLTDVLERRARIALFETNAAREVAPVVAELMARELGWKAERVATELESFARQCESRLAWRESAERRSTDVGRETHT